MPRRLTKKALILLISGALVVVGGGVFAAAVVMSQPVPEEPAEVMPRAGVHAEFPERPVEIPRVASARASVDGWNLAARTVVSAVLPEVGNAADGAVSLRIDAPVADPGVIAASAPIVLAPETEYTLTASVRLLGEYRGASGVELAAGGSRFQLPDLNAEWETVEFSFTTPVEQAEGTLDVILTTVARGFGLDNIVISAAGGDNLVANPSFEQVQAPQGIVNDSLILSTETASLAVVVAEGTSTWSATSSSGGDPITGSAVLSGGLAAVPLDGLPQGHYALTFTDSVGFAISTNIAVLDNDGLYVPQDARFGVATHVERVGFDGAGVMASSLGFSEARNDVTWSAAETAAGEYDWSNTKYPAAFAELHSNGVKLLALVVYGNKLYGSQRTPSTPAAVEAYGRYALEIARTYDVVGLEVFNEFNHRDSDASCGKSATCYLPLLESVHRQVDVEFPDLPIVAGSTAYYDRDWFISLWQNGGLEYTDVVSYHPYEAWRDRAPDSLGPIIQQSHADMQEQGGADKPVWITEFGYPTHNPGGVGIMEQGPWLIRTEVTSIAAGTEKFFWYDLVNDKNEPAAGEANFGLFEHNPRSNVLARSPKPAAFAQALVISQISGLAFTADESDEASTVKVFGDGDEETRVAWAPGGGAERVVTSDVPLSVVSMSGATQVIESIDGQVTVPLSDLPVFIKKMGELPELE
ncbi:cellulase family glycosylhydrolase [Microbacterium sp. A93]|uniref:cellulase family glycosylhydrolase n=1 Tax=Microbacterium sp. A93 TaxID=3450716 RepID=UPI003F442B8E